MPIPPLDQDGFLPPGLHGCNLAEIKATFGSFRGHSRRPELFDRLAAYIAEFRETKVATELVIDGRFVTDKPAPNDIDLIVVLSPEHEFVGELIPSDYNVISKRSVHRRFGFDLLVARAGSAEYSEFVEFFQQVRLEPGRRKGILKIAP